MFIFRFLEFLLKIFGTLLIVIGLQAPLGEQSLEEHLLGFLRGSDKLEFVKNFTTDGKQVFQKKAHEYLQQTLETRKIAQKEDQVENETLTPVQKLLTPIVSQYLNQLEHLLQAKIPEEIPEESPEEIPEETPEESLTEEPHQEG